MTLPQTILEEIGTLDYSHLSGNINQQEERELVFDGEEITVRFTVKGYMAVLQSQLRYDTPPEYNVDCQLSIEDFYIASEERQIQLNTKELNEIINGIDIYYGN